MSGFLTKSIFASLILVGLAFAALAQNQDNSSAPVPASGASFLPTDVGSGNAAPEFSGLAVPPDPAQIAAPANQMTSVPSPVPSPIAAAIGDLAIPPVTVSTLPNISPESIGTQSADGLGADMWKGSQRSVVEKLLTIIAPTASPTLNELARRLLATAAVPPEGDADSAQGLTSLRIEKMTVFGATADAWALAKNADAKLVSDASFYLAAENTLTGKTEADEACGQGPALAKAHPGADWQTFLIVCQMRAKDMKAAQVALDVYRTQNNRDNVFLGLADKNILSSVKMLPFQLTPLTPPTLALLQMADRPLPGELYAHPDFDLVPALLRLKPQQDVAQISLAERAAARGMIPDTEVAAVYDSINFPADALAAPLTSSESGLRLRALLFRAAQAEKDPAKRIPYAVKFIQSAPTAFLNGAGGIAADMLGSIKPDPALGASAASVARIYMLAGKGDAALEWLRLAQSNSANADELQSLWPQFALAGLESDSAYAADFDKWLDAALKGIDPQTGRDNVGAVLLLLDAAGLKVSDAAWAQVMTAPHNEKRASFSPVFFERMQAAAAAGKKAETVLLAVAVAGEDDISLPVAVGIARALRLVGFKGEAATFARQTVALLLATAN